MDPQARPRHYALVARRPITRRGRLVLGLVAAGAAATCAVAFGESERGFGTVAVMVCLFGLLLWVAIRFEDAIHHTGGPPKPWKAVGGAMFGVLLARVAPDGSGGACIMAAIAGAVIGIAWTSPKLREDM